MSLGLVAYGSSDESGDDSNSEEMPVNIVASSKYDVGMIENKNQNANVEYKNTPESNELPISDDEDDIHVSSTNQFGALHLPPPRQVTRFQSKSEQLQQDKSLSLNLPTPKSEAEFRIQEDELEDFVKPKKREKEFAQEIPPTKKRKTVQITIPKLQHDSDEEEDSKSQKTIVSTNKKCGLFSVLPQPKNVAGSKELGRQIIPGSLSKKTSIVDKEKTSVSNEDETQIGKMELKTNMFIPQSLMRKPKQSSISAFNLETGMMMMPKKGKKNMRLNKTCESEAGNVSGKSVHTSDKAGALSLVSGVSDDESEEEEDSSTSNFFSIKESSESVDIIPTVSSSTNPEQSSYADKEFIPQNQDAPLQFKNSNNTYASCTVAHSHASNLPSSSAVYKQYESEQSYMDQSAPEVLNAEASSDFIHDQEFLKMQGKSKRGKEEINFIDVRQEDQMSNVNVALKNLTEETSMMSHSKKKNKDMPSSQQKRKHQITYLAFKAKEAELELKNTWANNRQTKKQTQAKYGF